MNSPRVCVIGKGPIPSNCEIISLGDLIRNPSLDVIGLVYARKLAPIALLKKLNVLRIITADPSEDPVSIGTMIASSRPMLSAKIYPLRIYISYTYNVSGTDKIGVGRVLTGILQSNNIVQSARNLIPLKIKSVKEFEFDMYYPKIEAPAPLAELVTEPSDLRPDDILYLTGTSGPVLTRYFEIYTDTMIEGEVTVTLFNRKEVNCKVVSCESEFKTIFSATLESEEPIYLDKYSVCPEIGRLILNRKLSAIVHRIII